MRNPNDPSLVHKALAKAQSVERRLDALIGTLSPQAPSILYNGTSTVISQATGGSYTWTCPAGVTSILVECWGAGAGGGGGGSGQGGEGGGGGAYSAEPAYPVTPGTVYSYIVGAGGGGGITGHRGTAGDDTYFDFNVFAAGGNPTVLGGVGGAGGAAVLSTNTVAFSGGDGSGSGLQSTGGCGGGTSASPAGDGVTGAGDSAGATGTAGGAGGTDKGAGGAGGNSGLSGVTGGGPGGGGGGAGAATGSSQVNLSYQPTSTGSYYGSDASGGNANGRRNVNGVMYAGGETASGGTYNGTQKSLMILPSSVQSDLSGVTIDSLTVRMQNQHSWYNSGLGVNIGYTPNTSLPTAWSGSGAVHTSSYHLAEGSNTTVDVTGSALGAALASGAAKALYIGLGPAYDLTQYGYFTGAGHTFSPLVTVTGHTGAAQVQAGAGHDGKVRITYSSTTTIVAAVQAAAGTDDFGNSFGAGLSTSGLLLYGTALPATPPAGDAIVYANLNGIASSVNSSGHFGQLVVSKTSRQSLTCNSGSATAVTAAFPYAANDAVAGAVYRLKASGVGTYTSGTTQWWQCKCFGNGQAQASINSLPNGFIWEAEAEVAIATIGSSGTAYVRNRVLISTVGSGTASPTVAIGMTGGSGGTTVTVDTTAASSFSLVCAVNGTSTITGLWSSLERLGS